MWDEETGLYYLSSRYYDPSWGRFVNADTQLARGEFRLFDHDAFCYCHQNPVNRSDSEGDTDISATLQQNVQVALPVLAPITVNPVVAFFLVLLWPAPTANSDASTIPCYDGAVAIPRSEEKVKTNTQTLDAAPSLPKKAEKDTVIYRWGGAAPENLVPDDDDIEHEDKAGLSFSTIPKPDAAWTTINIVNATGVLTAKRDGRYHVSVRPVGANLSIWKTRGIASIWTQTLRRILIPLSGGLMK